MRHDPKKFMISVIFCLLLGLSFVAIINYWKNPFGNHQAQGSFLTYNDRIAKINFLKKFSKEELPKGYIFGPSTVLPFKSFLLEEKTGIKFFNFGSFWERVEGFWSKIKFLQEDLGARPEFIFLGIETWCFADSGDGPYLFENIRRRYLNTPDLIKHYPNYSKLDHILSKSVELISLQQFKTSVKLWKMKRNEILPLEKSLTYSLDGSNKSYTGSASAAFIPEELNLKYEEFSKSKLFLNKNEIAEVYKKEIIKRRHLRSYFPSNQISSEKVKLMKDLMRYCDKNKIKLVIVLLPTHPVMYDLLSQYHQHQVFIREIINEINSVAKSLKYVDEVFDYSHIYKFNGNVRSFHDRVHIGPVNAKIIVDKIFSGGSDE